MLHISLGHQYLYLEKNIKEHNLIANYNEGLAYNFNSISGYTSCPDDNQIDFLHKLGYRRNGNHMNITNNPIISANCLLGVKYLISEYPVKGYSLFDNTHFKNVYNTDITLPLSFTVPIADIEYKDDDPFIFQNSLYSVLLGEDVELYKTVDYQKIESDGKITFSIDTSDSENYAYYCYIPSNRSINGIISVNDYYENGYSMNLSPDTYYIPSEEGDDKASVSIISEDPIDLKTVIFYSLDLDKLKTVSSVIRTRQAEINQMKNGYVSITADSDGEEYLLVSVPYNKDWAVTINGKKAQTELFADCLYMIRMEKGINSIEMEYHAGMVWQGILISFLGLVFLFLYHRLCDCKHQ